MSEPRRLLALVPGGLYAGAEIVLLRNLDEARRRGWSVEVGCADGPLVARLDERGIQRRAIPDLRLPEGRRAFALGALALRVVRCAAQLRRLAGSYDLILANGINTLPAVRAARALGVRAPCVWFAHDVLVRGDRLRLMRLSRRAVDRAIAVSEATATPLRAVGIDTTVVWNGTSWPVEPAPENPPVDGPPIIGLSAVLTAHKGQMLFLDAIARMQHRDVVAELLGGVLPKDGGFAATLRARAQHDDLEGRVRFLGYEEDPLARMRTWTVSVSASTDPEAGPLTALEAMSLGVPFVATAHGGVVEVLGDAGLLVEPADPGALAAAFDRLLSDPALRGRCRAAGPPTIDRLGLSIADHCRKVVDELDRMI